MQTKFKKGDKVEIPKTKRGKASGDEFEKFKKQIADYKYDYLLISHPYSPDNIGVEGEDNFSINANSFTVSDLVPYKEKKIVGYKLVDQEMEKVVVAILHSKLPDLNEIELFHSEGELVNLTDDSRAKEVLLEYDVLDKWFEPVYKREKMEVEAIVGNPARTIVINNNGEIKYGDSLLPIADVQTLFHVFEKTGGIGMFVTYPKTIWIGCIEKGTAVTQHDVESVINIYQALNQNT